MRFDRWLAHEHPGVPLSWGAWLCDCEVCAVTLEAAAFRDPLLPIVVQGDIDRVVVSVTAATACRREVGSLEPLLVHEGARVREVFVGRPRSRSGPAVTSGEDDDDGDQ